MKTYGKFISIKWKRTESEHPMVLAYPKQVIETIPRSNCAV